MSLLPHRFRRRDVVFRKERRNDPAGCSGFGYFVTSLEIFELPRLEPLNQLVRVHLLVCLLAVQNSDLTLYTDQAAFNFCEFEVSFLLQLFDCFGQRERN